MAAKSVRSDAKLTDEFIICDNVNLETIVVEFETFYYQRFKMYPQLCKRNVVARKENVNRGCNKLKLKSDSFQKSSIDESGFTADFIVCNTYKQSNIEACDTMTIAKRDSQWVHNDDWKEYVNLISQVRITKLL